MVQVAMAFRGCTCAGALLGFVLAATGTVASTMPARAQEERSASTAAPHSPHQSRRVEASTSESTGLKLAWVDSLSIRFHGQPTLSGEYRISGDETISLPMIGRFDVRGMTLVGLENLLSSEFLRVAGRDIYPTVEVSAYREVTVSGAVARPSAHPWRRGMTVIHAEALAGGIFRPLSAGGNAANTALAFGNERTKARRAAADLTRLTVQLARLEAERKSEREFVTPDRARATADPKEVSEIVAAQQSLMNSRQATYDATIKSLARVRDNTETELRLERERLTKAEALLKNRRSRLAKLRELADRRIISEERTLGEEAAVMELEERISALALNQMRLEKGRMGAELEISILERKRAADVEAEIQSVERDLAKLQIDLDGASSSFRTLSGQSALDTASDAGAITTYRIVRTIDGASKVLRADKSTPLVPGDVLLVELDNGGRS